MNLPGIEPEPPDAAANPAYEALNVTVADFVSRFNFHEQDDTAVVLAYGTEDLERVLEWKTPTLTEVVRDALAIIEADLREGRESRKGIDVFRACLEMHDRTKVPHPQAHRLALTLSRAEISTVCRLRLGPTYKVAVLNRHALVENGDIVAMCAWLAVHNPEFFSEAMHMQILLAQRCCADRRGASPKSKEPIKFHFTREQKLNLLDLGKRMGPKTPKTAVIEKAISETVRYYAANGPEHVKIWATSPRGLYVNDAEGIPKLPQETISVRADLLPPLDLLVARFSTEYRKFSRQDLILQLGLPLVELSLEGLPQAEPEAGNAVARPEPIRFSPYLASPLVARQTPALLFGTPPGVATPGKPVPDVKRLEDFPPETPVLLDAWLVALAIAGGTNRAPFSKQAAAFLDLRIQHRPELALSALEVPKLFEWLDRLEAAPATDTPRAEWLRKLLADLETCFRILVPNEADAAEAATLHLTPRQVGLSKRHGTDGLLQAVCARRLYPQGFAIATVTNEYDHLTGVFGVHKPQDAAMWDSSRR